MTTTIVTPVSKTSIARPIFEQMKSKGYACKDILKMFQSEAGMTEQGAATSYYNFTKMMKEGKLVVAADAPATAVVPKEVPIAPADTDVENMSDVELAMFYIKHVPVPNLELKARAEILEAVYYEVAFEQLVD